jgi:hypothetical protein
VDAALTGAAAQYLFEDSINLGAFVIPASMESIGLNSDGSSGGTDACSVIGGRD